MKVLFLDDDQNRMVCARIHYSNDILSEATTVEEAIRMLEKYSPYDLVSLDHDLGGYHFVESDEKSGYEVAKYIARMQKEKLPKRVIIHSYNPAGAANMFSELIDIVYVTRIPFNLC